MLNKSNFKSLLAGALALAGSAAFAQTTPTPDHLAVGMYQVGQANKIRVFVKKQPNTLVSVQLLGTAGQQLYQGSLPKKGDKFTQIFDMNELKDGAYTLRIKQGKEVIDKLIQLQTAAPEPATPVRFVTLGE